MAAKALLDGKSFNTTDDFWFAYPGLFKQVAPSSNRENHRGKGAIEHHRTRCGRCRPASPAQIRKFARNRITPSHQQLVIKRLLETLELVPHGNYGKMPYATS
jgi:hypothetical protein